MTTSIKPTKSVFQEAARTFKLRKRVSHLLKTGGKVLAHDEYSCNIIQGEIVDKYVFDKEICFQIESYHEIDGERWLSIRWFHCKNIIKKIFN